MQACFGACARIVVRELRKTETTDIIMVYSGTMHLICATIACIAVPGSVIILQHTWQVLTLLATGKESYWRLLVMVLFQCMPGKLSLRVSET